MDIHFWHDTIFPGVVSKSDRLSGLVLELGGMRSYEQILMADPELSGMT